MYLKIINREITADRWPWQVRKSSAWMATPDEAKGQKYGWKPTKGMGRFGGGWNWELGVSIGRASVILNLLYGMVRISKPSRCGWCGEPILSGQKTHKWKADHGTKRFHLECTDASYDCTDASYD